MSIRTSAVRGIIIGLVLILGFAASAAAQGNGLVASHRVATISETQINRRMDEVFGASAPERLRGSLNLYKVTYRSVEANGRNAVFSGLVVIPSGGAPNGLVVFN